MCDTHDCWTDAFVVGYPCPRADTGRGHRMRPSLYDNLIANLWQNPRYSQAVTR